jgi:hypothetical protein
MTLLDPITVVTVICKGWHKHISLTNLTDEACSIWKFSVSLSANGFTIMDNKLVKVTPSLESNDELDMKLGPWVEAACCFVHMLCMSLKAGSAENITHIADAWEAHFNGIQSQPNLQDNFFSDLWLLYDITLWKAYICLGQHFNPTVLQTNVLATVQWEALKCQATETWKIIQLMLSASSSASISHYKQPMATTIPSRTPAPCQGPQPRNDSPAKCCFLCRSTEHGPKQCKTPIYLKLHEGHWAKLDRTQICYTFNGVSGCTNASGTCAFEHGCSLCGQSHHAPDCKA